MVFETIVVNRLITTAISNCVDTKQFGSIAGTCTKNASLVQMLHKWYEATDDQGPFIRVLLVDCSTVFDLINHILINKLSNTDISPFIVRWVASFLKDRNPPVKVGG